MSSVFVRKAKEDDDFLQIASCLYLTDSFIYPAAFGGDPDRAARAIAALMRLEDGLFQPSNIAVATQGDEVCGAMLLNAGGSSWDGEACANAIQGIVPDIVSFKRVSEEYFSVEAADPEPGTVELVACCVLPNMRGKGVGRRLLEWAIRQHPGSALTLDVLADNLAAIALYEKCGFKRERSFRGFATSEAERPDCYRMVRPSDG